MTPTIPTFLLSRRAPGSVDCASDQEEAEKLLEAGFSRPSFSTDDILPPSYTNMAEEGNDAPPSPTPNAAETDGKAANPILPALPPSHAYTLSNLTILVSLSCLPASIAWCIQGSLATMWVWIGLQVISSGLVGALLRVLRDGYLVNYDCGQEGKSLQYANNVLLASTFCIASSSLVIGVRLHSTRDWPTLVYVELATLAFWAIITFVMRQNLTKLADIVKVQKYDSMKQHMIEMKALRNIGEAARPLLEG